MTCPGKVLLVANTDWYLYNFRFSLAQELRTQGYEVVFVSPPGKYTAAFLENGFRWVGWKLGRQTLSPWEEIPSIYRLIQIYRQEKPNLIHHHTIKPVLYGSFAARLLGIASIVNSITGRGYVFIGQDSKARWLRPLARAFYRLAFNSKNIGVIFENQTDRNYFIQEKLVSSDRTWLISGVGVDPVRFHPAAPPQGVPVVLWSGRMLWDKGIGVLVEATRILHQQGDVRVVVAGEPDPGNPASIDTATLSAWVKEGVIENWGWQADMLAAYHRCHIVAVPTMYGEGVPTVLLEAGACALPVVATDMPGCRDVVVAGVNGFLVPPGDPLALATALRKLILDSELRAQMGFANRQHILANYTAGEINSATMAVYKQFLEN